MSYRSLNSNLVTSLTNNENHGYTHLIKFEKPGRQTELAFKEGAKPSNNAEDFSYLTDGAYEVRFDDGTKNSKDVDNGPQTYFPNKVKSVGTVSETIEAKATNMNITLYASALSVSLSGSLVITSSKITAPSSWVSSGFAEGDTVELSSSDTTDANHGMYVRIDRFENDNKDIIYTNVETSPVESTYSQTGTTATITSEAHGLSNGQAVFLEFFTGSLSSNNAHNLQYTISNVATDTFDVTVSTSSSTSGECRYKRVLKAETDTYTASFSSPEINALTESKEATDYSSYLNREVFIYRAHINPSTGVIIGAPFLIFKGIIINAKAQERINSEATIAWTLTSHWGDFVSVNGRMTSDHAHRALGPLGTPQKDAVFKPEYVSDYGFMHAESAVNILATYQAPEKRYKFKKSGFAGLGSGRTIEYEVMVDREVDLEFNLSAKFIPVVYGVQQVSGIPFFAEGNKRASDQVFVNFALSEGPIQSILDMSIDDNRLICLNDKDASERGSGSDAKLPCFGAADKGDVLLGGLYVDPNNDYDEQLRARIEELEAADLLTQDQITELSSIGDELEGTSSSVFVTTGGAGIRHEFKYDITDPLEAHFTFHAGLPDQRANSLLAQMGSSKSFKVQNMYYSDMPGSRYYGSRHQVLDTAYVSVDATVDNTQSTLPSVEYVVKGRVLDCFNYDRSYRGSGTQSDFDLGATVTLHTTHATGAPNNLAANAQIGSESVQIIDKWSFYNQDGDIEYRFRFSKNLHLAEESAVSEDIKSFYMKIGSSKYYFVAYDSVEKDVNGADIAGKPLGSVSSYYVESNGISSPFFSLIDETISYAGNHGVEQTATRKRGQFAATGTSHFSRLSRGNHITASLYDANYQYEGSNTFRITEKSSPNLRLDLTTLAYQKSFVQRYNGSSRKILYNSDIIFVDYATSSTTNDFYNGKKMNITRIDNNGQTTTRTGLQIVDYVVNTTAETAYVRLRHPLGSFLEPINATFRYAIEGDTGVAAANVQKTLGQLEDKRVSINPAIQLLDYMTNKRYGRGLDIDNDIDLESFLSVARACDEQSNVTINILKRNNEAQPAVGAVYKYAAANGRILFQGKVKTSTPISIIGSGDSSATDFYEVTFEEVIGKLGHKWNYHRTFIRTEQIVLHEGVAFKAGSAGSNSPLTTAERNTQISNAAFVDADGGQNLNLEKVSGTGHATIRVSVDKKYGLPNDRNPVVRKKVGIALSGNGYTLYDSDFCKYWLLLGWDEPEQRYVTRHQTNMTIDTSKSVFSNINAMMKQFNAMLKYSNGKYVLAIKSKAPADSHFTSSFPVKDIDEGEIIGDVSVDDSGSKKKFNTLNTQIIDPANNFSGRSITYVNSDYIKQDRGVKKQGNYNAPGITNYFNARMNVKQMLDESRYGLTAKFTIDSKGYLLQAGDVIRITYSRFGWENKYFRIESLNFSGKGLVQVVAKEHNDEAFVIEHLDTFRNADTMEGSNQGAIPVAKPTVPTSASASDDKPGKVQVTWTNGTNFDVAVHVTQVARHNANIADVNNVSGTATIIATTPASNYIDAPPGDFSAGDVTNYYWVRHLYTANQGDKHARPHNKFTAWVACGTGTAKQVTPIEIEGNASQGAARGITISDGGVTMDIDGGSGTPKIKGGQSAYDTGIGFFLGYDTQTTSAYKFSVGNASGNKLTFDGTNLAVTGNITAQSLSLANTITIGQTNLPIDVYASSNSVQLNEDPYFTNASGDYWFAGSSPNTSTNIDNPSGQSYETNGTNLPTNRSTYFKIVDNDTTSDNFWNSQYFTINSGKTYKVTVWARQTGGDRKNYLLVDFRDSNNDRINNSSNPTAVAAGSTGWASIGTYHYFGVSNQVLPSTYTKYEVVFGENSSTVKAPAGAVKFLVGGLLARDGSTETTIEIAQYLVEEFDSTVINAALNSAGGWTIDDEAIFTGTKDSSGYNGGNNITLHKDGGIHAKKFYIDGSDGSAHFKGAIEGGSIGGENTNAIPSTVFSRTVANSKGAPTGNETGGFIDLTTGDFVFGDANTFISFSPTSDDSNSPARKLTLKGDLEAENLTVTSSISTPLLKVGRLESGTVRVADIREEVFSEIDSRLGNTGGYYASYETYVGNTDDGYQGEDPTAPYVKDLTNGNSGFQHAGETTFLNFALNDQFAAPVSLSTNTAAGRHPNDRQITAKFQKKIAGQADSTYVNVGSIRTFILTETLIPYATRYTAEFSMSETITTDSSGDATDPNNHISGTSYIYRVVLAAVAQPGGSTYKSYFKTYYAANGTLEGIGANDQAASPVFFEIREGSIGSSAGNLDTSQFITHTADNDTNIEFLDDKIKLNAGGETMITLTEDTSDTITLHKDTTVSTNLTVSGNLTVAGTSTTLNTSDLNVKDKNIILNYNATGDTSSTANGAGITIQDAVDASTDATILWDNTNDEFDFSHPVNVSGVVKSEHDSNNYAQLESNSSGGVFKAVANNVTTAMIRSYGDSFFDTDTLYIDASENNVGIGTTTPLQQLHISGGTSSGAATKVAIGATGTNAESHLQLAERFTGNDMNYGFSFIADGNNTNNLLIKHHNNSTTGSTGLCMARGTGFIGLGTTAPTRRLHIVDTSNTPETDRSAVHIDMNLGDADPEVALSADKTARGIFVDLDSTVSSGDANEEHRIYGIVSDIDVNSDGDSDLAYGVLSHAQVNSNAGQTTALRGYHGHAVNHNEGSHRTNVTMGGHFLADHHSESSTANTQSYYGSNNIARFLAGATVDAYNLYGALNEVDINPADGTAGKVDGAIAATYSLIDNNDSADDEIEVGNSYLFFGTYSPNDTGFGNHRSGTRSYGIYVQSDVPNFFAGKVGLNGGATAPEYQLDIGRETSSTDNTIRIAQANGGTAIRVGTGGGDSDVTLLRVDGQSTEHNGESDNSQFGFSLKYMGSRSLNANSLSLFSDNQQDTAVEAVTVTQDGSVGINQTSPAARVQIEDLGIETTSTSVSSTNATVVDTFAKATFRSARYTVQITQGSAYQCSDIMAIHDGTTAIGTEYAMIETGSILGTLDVAVNGDNVELKVTMAAATAATVKVVRHCVAV